MDIGVIGNRRTAAGDLMLPVKMLEYICLDIPVVVPRLKTIEHYFSDDMVAYYEPEDVESLANAIYRLYREPGAARQTGRAGTRVSLTNTGGSDKARNWCISIRHLWRTESP